MSFERYSCDYCYILSRWIYFYFWLHSHNKNSRDEAIYSIFLHFFADTNIWSREISVPDNKDIPYRYLICTIDPMTENVHVRRWETHLAPRIILAYTHDHRMTTNGMTVQPDVSASTSIAGTETKIDIDTFGDIAGVEKIDRGWLTTETVLQFKFIRNPFVLKQKLKNRLLFVKVWIRFHNFNWLAFLYENGVFF